MTERACGNCEFGCRKMVATAVAGKLVPSKEIECRRYPPFLRRHEADWCGEFKQRDSQTDAD